MTDKEEKLKNLDTRKLIDVVKNYRQYGYDENLRLRAISILEDRGITKEQLEMTGDLVNRTYDFAEDLYKSYVKNSRIAFVLYCVVILILILFPILSIDPEIRGFSVLGLFLLYSAFLVKSFIKESQFSKAIGQDHSTTEGFFVYLFLGMPFYIFMYFYFRNQMKNKMTGIK